ncbi:integrase, catalytic region, zinc finger, CCHC-type containing protein [Tanacetum coccineum]
MADMNMPANDVPAKQAHAIAPPTRTDDQILPSSKCVPIGKSNCVLDVQKSQRNPIFLIAVAILKNSNFFRAFTTSSTILAIYIQQFWDTMCFNSSTGLYSFSRGKKKTAHLLIPNIRFTKPIIHRLKNKHNIHPRLGLALYYSHEENILNTLSTPYYSSYLEHVTEYQRYLNEEHDKADDKSPELALSQPPKPTPTLTESSKKDQDEGVPEKEPVYDDEEVNLQRALELSLKEQGERT